MVFAGGGHTIEVWFQRQWPLGTGSWRYDGGSGLRGIPDIILTHSLRAMPMVIDAKYRYAVEGTRAEETYKLLGYAENFRDRLEPFWGLLCFVGMAVSDNSMSGPKDGRIVVLRCDEKLDDVASYDNALDHAIQKWTAAVEHG